MYFPAIWYDYLCRKIKDSNHISVSTNDCPPCTQLFAYAISLTSVHMVSKIKHQIRLPIALMQLHHTCYLTLKISSELSLPFMKPLIYLSLDVGFSLKSMFSLADNERPLFTLSICIFRILYLFIVLPNYRPVNRGTI